ncbi:MAG: hypothetical protein JEY94_08370 [Melioribacteraceae bacterium]|nr:hypothetical protein [Melioribacteraceae bacterium]
MKIRITQISIIIILLSSFLQAQIGVKLSVDQEYHSNPVGYIDPVSSLVTNIFSGVSYGDSLLNLGYYGNYNYLNSISERSSFQHQFGYWDFSENSMWGGYIEQRINKDDYKYLDYSDIITFYRYKFDLSGISTLLSFNYNITDFKEYKSLNHNLFSGGFRLSKSYNTKTTIFLGTEINYKRYSENISITDSLGTHENNNDIFQLNTSLRIAQSVSESVGLALVGSKRIVLNDVKPLDDVIKFAIGDDAEIFDSPTSYNLNSIGIELTKVLENNIKLKSGYYYNHKDYKTQGTYINEEEFSIEKLRTDFSNMFYFQISKTVESGFLFFNEFDISFNYQYINNNSNSYWFNYSNSATSVSLNFNL